MHKIYTDNWRLNFTPWNQALGNKILHLLFALNYANKHNYNPIIMGVSNLDNLFWLDDIKEKINKKAYDEIPYSFIEKTAFSENWFFSRVLKNIGKTNRLVKSINLSKKQYQEELLFLQNKPQYSEMKVRGHFWHYELMPSLEIFMKYAPIKDTVTEFVKTKYPSLLNNTSVAVHYRGTDFKNHLRHIFKHPITLEKYYYQNAINEVESRLGKEVEYHLFSDELDFLKQIFINKKVIVHTDDLYSDWCALFLSKNLISSNSTFCWTASLYNKDLLIQPKGGYNHKDPENVIPFGFYIKDAIKLQ